MNNNEERDRRRTATFFFHLGFGFSVFDTLNKKVETLVLFRQHKKKTLSSLCAKKKSLSALCWCLVRHATDFYGGDHPNNNASFSDDDDFWWGECATGKTRGACACGGAKNKCARQKQFKRTKEMASSSRDITTFPKTTLCDVLDDDGQRNGGGKGRRRGNHVEDER